MDEEQQQKELLAALEELVSKYEIYGTPKMSGGGDITIPLNPVRVSFSNQGRVKW